MVAQVTDTLVYSGTSSLKIIDGRDDLVPNWPQQTSGLWTQLVKGAYAGEFGMDPLYLVRYQKALKRISNTESSLEVEVHRRRSGVDCICIIKK